MLPASPTASTLRPDAQPSSQRLQLTEPAAAPQSTRQGEATTAPPRPLLAPGQTAQAQVLQVRPAAHAQSLLNILLSLGGQPIRAYSQTPLHVGQLLTVRQIAPDQLQIEPSSARPPQPLATLTQALRQQLPQQQPLAQFMRHLTTLLKPNAETARAPHSPATTSSSARSATTGTAQAGSPRTPPHTAAQHIPSQAQPVRRGLTIRTLQQVRAQPSAAPQSTTARPVSTQSASVQPAPVPRSAARHATLPTHSPAPSGSANAPSVTLPPAIRHTLQTLLRSAVLQPQTLTAAQLKEQISNSGLLLENKLLNGASRESLQQDLKANLTRLQQQLQQTLQQPSKEAGTPAALKELLGQTQQALARIQTHQLSNLAGNLQSQDTNTPTLNSWTLELPVQLRERLEAWQLRIEEQSVKDQEATHGKQWKVTLSAELEQLGTLHAQVVLGSGQLRTTLWVEQTQWVATVQQAVAPLEQRLRSLGIEVPPIQCYPGCPANPRTRLEQQLVDLKA